MVINGIIVDMADADYARIDELAEGFGLPYEAVQEWIDVHACPHHRELLTGYVIVELGEFIEWASRIRGVLDKATVTEAMMHRLMKAEERITRERINHANAV